MVMIISIVIVTVMVIVIVIVTVIVMVILIVAPAVGATINMIMESHYDMTGHVMT